MMAKAGATFQTSRVFAGLIIVAGTGIIITVILQRIERRFQAWKPPNNTSSTHLQRHRSLARVVVLGGKSVEIDRYWK